MKKTVILKPGDDKYHDKKFLGVLMESMFSKPMWDDYVKYRKRKKPPENERLFTARHFRKSLNGLLGVQLYDPRCSKSDLLQYFEEHWGWALKRTLKKTESTSAVLRSLGIS